MKKFVVVATALSGLLAFAASASAADVTAPADPVYDWTGFYVGAHVGYGWSDSTVDYDDTGFPGFHANLDPEGFLGGAQLGYKYQTSGGIVFGPELDFSLSGADGSAPLLNPADVVVGGQSFDSEVDWSGAARLKLGFAADRLLPFIAGGIAFSNYDVSNTVGGTTENAFDDTLVGWTVGGGLDYAVTDHVTAGLEYRFSDYGRHHVATTVFDDYHVDLKTHDVRFTLNYKF